MPDGRKAGLTFSLIAWSCLVALEVYYLAAVLLPFFLLGVYKMSRREMFEDPNLMFPDPAIGWPCALFACGVIPLLIFAITDTVLTWRTSSRRAHILRLTILGLTALIIVVSINSDNLFSWGFSFEVWP